MCIEAEVHRGGALLMSRTFYEPTMTLEHVIRQLEQYIVQEQLNVPGECLVRVRFQRGGVA